MPASFLLLALAGRLTRRSGSYVACGVLLLASVLGLAFAPGEWVIVSAGLIGFVDAALFVLMLALPPLLSELNDVHRVSAGMFTISYSCAVVMPILSGLVWDMTGLPIAAFLPIGICALAIIALAMGLRLGPPDTASQ